MCVVCSCIDCVSVFMLWLSVHPWHSVVQAEYWHDPLNEDEYKKDCVFLPDINQENVSVVSGVCVCVYIYVYTVYGEIFVL